MENPKTNHGDQNDLKTWRDYEERTDAENKQIYDDALHDGRRVENGPVMTSGGKEIIHNQITEFVPGASGRLEDMCARLATQITNHDGSIEQITQYYLPGHIVDDVTVRSNIKEVGHDLVETVTGVYEDAPGSSGIKVGDTRIVPPSSSTHAGLLPNTIDPPSGKFGVTVHPDEATSDSKAGSNSPSSGSSNTGGSGDNSLSSADSQHAPFPSTSSASNKSGGGNNSPSTADSNAGSNSPAGDPQDQSAPPSKLGGGHPDEDDSSAPSGTSAGFTHFHKGIGDVPLNTNGVMVDGSGCPGEGGEVEWDSNGKIVCRYTPPTQVEVIPPSSGGNAETKSSSDKSGSDASNTTHSEDNKSDGQSDSNKADGDTADTNENNEDDETNENGDDNRAAWGDGTIGDNGPPSHHFGSDSDFVPVISHSLEDAIGTPAGAPIHFGDSNDPNANPEEVDLAAVLAAHPRGGTDPTNTDPVEEKGDVHSGLGVTVSNAIRPGMDGSLYDGVWADPDDPRNYQGDDQWNPPDPSIYGDGATSQAQGQSQLQSPQSMVPPTASAEGMGQSVGPSEAFGGAGQSAGPGQAFWQQAEDASDSSLSSPASSTGFGTAGQQGSGSGGQAAGQFSPLSGNHSEGEQSNSGVQLDLVQSAHHVDASVPYVHIDPLPDISHHMPM